MNKTIEGMGVPRLISWALRVSAGLLLAYMVVLILAELGPWFSIYIVFSPDRPGWVTSLLYAIILANMLIWPLWCGFVSQALQPVVQPELKNKPVMAAMWFIIPGAFLFTPWAVVREIYLSSRDPLDWAEQKAPIVGWWWCLRLLFYFGIWPLCTLGDPDGSAYGRVLILQVLISIELALQIIILTEMTRWQARPLSMKAADDF